MSGKNVERKKIVSSFFSLGSVLSWKFRVEVEVFIFFCKVVDGILMRLKDVNWVITFYDDKLLHIRLSTIRFRHKSSLLVFCFASNVDHHNICARERSLR